MTFSVAAFTKIANAVADYRLGIRDGIRETNKPGAIYYATIRHNLIREVLDRLHLSTNDVFIDIGCGKGRVLAIANRSYPPQTLLGVEYEPALVEIAKRNVAGSKIAILQGAAEHFDYSKITVAYAFNPVGPDVLQAILAKIERDRMSTPFGTRKSFRIAYVMEGAEWRAVFDGCEWLKRYDSFTNSAGHIVSFYRSR